MLSNHSLENFYLEMTGRAGACVGSDRFGLVARAAEADQVLLFGITCDGQYALRIWDDESFSTVIPWTPHTAIRAGSGEENRIGLMATGNGTWLNSVMVDSPQEGRFGMFIGSAETEDFQVDVSEVSYWEAP
jgi:hypothetical protein